MSGDAAETDEDEQVQGSYRHDRRKFQTFSSPFQTLFHIYFNIYIGRLFWNRLPIFSQHQSNFFQRDLTGALFTEVKQKMRAWEG